MRKLMMALALVLVVPALASANGARVRALAGGNADFLPDDRATTDTWANRAHEHSVITMEDVNPTSSETSGKTAHVSESALRWGGFQTHIERIGRTAGFFVNRPNGGRTHQLLYRARQDHGPTPIASSVVDFVIGNERSGLNAAWGYGSRTFTDSLGDGETTRNMYFDANWGMNMASGMELSIGGFMSQLGDLDLEEQDKNAFGAFGKIRKQMEMPFFNHLTVGANYFKNSKYANDEDVDAANAFAFNVDLFNYTKGAGTGPDDLTYLLAIGTQYSSVVMEGVDAERVNNFTLPRATAGAELALTSWFVARGSVMHSFNFAFVDEVGISGGSGTTTTLGAGVHWGKLAVDAVVNNNLLTDGPDFIGGQSPGLSSYVSADWAL